MRVFREEAEVAPAYVIAAFWQVELRSFGVVAPVQSDGEVFTMLGHRHGPRRVCLGLTGGFIDPAETPEAAAPDAMAPQEVDAASDSGRFGVIHHVAGWCLALRHPDFPSA